MKTLTKTTKKHWNYPWRELAFVKTWVTFSSQKTGDAAPQVTSKCCKLQQLHYGLNLWWSLDGSLTSFCDKQSGDAAADIGATLSCAAGGYGEPWCFAKPQIDGTTNMQRDTKVDPSFFVRAIFLVCACHFVRLGREMLKCLTLFLLAFFFGSLAFQKNPSLVWLTWSREKKLKDIVAILALIFLRQMTWFVSGWMAIMYWLYELPFFFLLQKW